RRRHADWHLALAERGEKSLTGAEQVGWLERLEAEDANFGAAMDWALERRDATLGLRLAAALWRVWMARGHARDGWKRFETILALPQDGVSAAVRARALQGYAILANNLGSNAEAKRALDRALSLCKELGDEAGVAQAL